MQSRYYLKRAGSSAKSQPLLASTLLHACCQRYTYWICPILRIVFFFSFLDRKILDKCLIASVLLLNGKNSWQTHCMEFCRGQIRERNVIRLGRTGIGRDRAYFSSFVLRSVTVSSRISLSFNLVSRLILHRLQGPGGHTQLDWNICWKHLQCLSLLSPQENKYSTIQIVVIDVVDCN